MSILALLVERLGAIFELSAAQFDLLDSHWQLLLKWNRKMNLTRITDPQEAVLRHYGESLFLAGQLTPGRVVDVGSGA
ncbi:MAG: RsmG family class I SAM-dependent methyltransferase, partial [Bryobacteraceae bacterium]